MVEKNSQDRMSEEMELGAANSKPAAAPVALVSIATDTILSLKNGENRMSEPIVYETHDVLGTSDLSDSQDVARANVRSLEKMFAKSSILYGRYSDIVDAVNKLRTGSFDDSELSMSISKKKPELLIGEGSHGTINAWILEGEKSDEILRSLSDYPALDDQEVSNVSSEMERESWDDWINREIRDNIIRSMYPRFPTREIPEKFEDAYDSIDSEKLFGFYCQAKDKTGEQYVIESSGGFIKTKKLTNAMLEILIENGLWSEEEIG